FHRLILDECQFIKNSNSSFCKSVMQIRINVKWLLSGTPIMIRVYEIHPYLRILGFRNLNSLHMHNNIYAMGPFAKHGSHFFYGKIQNILKNIAIRRTKDILSLPEKTYSDRWISLSIEERHFHETLK
ncbi:SNF2 family N-terminal domain-containing protein, partial [Blyttiomyces helicus]